MDTCFCRVAASLTVLAVAIGTVSAETITYGYTGTVVDLDWVEGGPRPLVGDEISGTISFELDAPGTPIGWNGDVVAGMLYESPSPPAKMTFTLQDSTFESAGGVGVLIGNDLPSDLGDSTVDYTIFAMSAPMPSTSATLDVVLRLEDTRRTIHEGVALPHWTPLERFDQRQLEVYFVENGSAQRVVRATIRTLTPVALTVPVNIRPGRFPNVINPESQDRVPVAVLTTTESDGVAFDSNRVNPATVRFGEHGIESSATHHVRRDVDDDGDLDLLLFFDIQDTRIQCGAIAGMVTGLTNNGRLIRGSDSIHVKPCGP
jgi:hypothetical protein